MSRSIRLRFGLVQIGKQIHAAHYTYERFEGKVCFWSVNWTRGKTPKFCLKSDQGSSTSLELTQQLPIIIIVQTPHSYSSNNSTYSPLMYLGTR